MTLHCPFYSINTKFKNKTELSFDLWKLRRLRWRVRGKKGENEHFCQAVIQSTWQDWRQWIPTECMEANVTQQQNHERWGDKYASHNLFSLKKLKLIKKICTSKYKTLSKDSRPGNLLNLGTPASEHEKLFTHMPCPGPHGFSLPLSHLLLPSVRIRYWRKENVKVTTHTWTPTTGTPANAESKLPCSGSWMGTCLLQALLLCVCLEAINVIIRSVCIQPPLWQ